MLALTLGYTSKKRLPAQVQLLYCGDNADAAKTVFQAPPEGILYTEMMVNPGFARRRNHDGSGAGFVAGEGDDDFQKEIDAAFLAKEMLKDVLVILEVPEGVDVKEFLATVLEERKQSAADLAKLAEVEKEICPEGKGLVDYVTSLQKELQEMEDQRGKLVDDHKGEYARANELAGLLETANGRVKELEELLQAEKRKLAESEKALAEASRRLAVPGAGAAEGDAPAAVLKLEAGDKEAAAASAAAEDASREARAPSEKTATGDRRHDKKK